MNIAIQEFYKDLNIVDIIFLIFFAIILVAFIIMFALGVFNFQPIPPIPTPPPAFPVVNYNFGQGNSPNAITLNNGLSLSSPNLCRTKTASWNSTTNLCECANGYFGPNCEFPIFTTNYYAGGQTIVGPFEFTEINKKVVDGVSFPQTGNNFTNVASNICDNDPGCVGFAIDYNLPTGVEATFYSKMEIKERGHLLYDTTLPSKYFIKQGRAPQFSDRVFLIKTPQPLRYWILDRFSDNVSETMALTKNTVYKVTFYPEKVVNDANLAGIWSNTEFNFTNLPTLINNPPAGFYRVTGNQLPPVRLGLPLYVGYMKMV